MREPCYIEPHVDNKSAAPWQVTKPQICLGQKESGFYVSKRLLWVLVEDVTTRMYIYINMIYVHVKKGRLPKSFHPLPSALGRSLWWRCSRPPMPMWVAAVAFVVHKAVVAIGSLRWNKVMWCLGSIKARLGDTWTAKNATFSASNLMNFFLGTSLRLYSVVVLEVSISLWSCVGMWFVNLILVGIQGGEKLVHWITPVTAGKRVILQIEMSRV